MGKKLSANRREVFALAEFKRRERTVERRNARAVKHRQFDLAAAVYKREK